MGKDGDFFRTVRFGGFHKEDVMRYIEELEARLHAQTQQTHENVRQLHMARREQFKWMRTVKVQRRRGMAANAVHKELEAFQTQLRQAQALLEEVERENTFLRRRIVVLEEEPSLAEPPVVPLEQLTFQHFLASLEENG